MLRPSAPNCHDMTETRGMTVRDLEKCDLGMEVGTNSGRDGQKAEWCRCMRQVQIVLVCYVSPRVLSVVTLISA